MKVLVYPRDRNPYQSLLYGHLKEHDFRVAYLGELTRSHTLNLVLLPFELVVRRLCGWRAVHLHWVYRFVLPVAGEREWARALMQRWFGLWLSVVRALGMSLVWTVHNVLPHQRVLRCDVEARRDLVRSADLLIAHTPAALRELAELVGGPVDGEVIPHAPYPVQPAPERVDRPRTLLFFGTIAAYKGVDDLLEAVRSVPGLSVVVAGECVDSALRDRLRSLAEPLGDKAVLRMERVPDDEVAGLMADADVVVLPFRQITTSGSALLALAHGKPLVVPNVEALSDLPDGAVFRYESLPAVLTEVAAAPPGRLREMGAHAEVWSKKTTWRETAARTAQAFAELPRRGSLVGDALGLFANTASLALSGFVFWVLAARWYPVEVVGEFSAVTASVGLLAVLVAFGLPTTVTRQLANARHGRELVLGAALVVVTAGSALGALAVPLFLPNSHSRGEVVALVVLTAVSAVLDAAMLAVRAVPLLLVKSVTGGLVKIGAVIALADRGAIGLISAYVLGALVPVVVAGGALWRRLANGVPFRLREVRPRGAGLTTAGYLGGVLGMMPTTVVPLLVLHWRGAAETAWMSVAFLLTGLLGFIPSSAAQALFAHASREPRAARTLALQALRSSYLLLAPAVFALVGLAPVVLGFFGDSYVDNVTTPLRLLALGTLISAASYVIDAMLIASGRRLLFVVVNGVNAALVLGGVLVGLQYGLVMAAIGWCSGQAASLGAAILLARLPERQC